MKVRSRLRLAVSIKPATPLEIATNELASLWQHLFDAERALENARAHRDLLQGRLTRLQSDVAVHTPTTTGETNGS